MRSRLLTATLTLAVAVLVGGADGCSSDPNLEGAKLNLQSGDYDRAIENVDAALAEDPDNVEALTLKVEVLRQQYENTPGDDAKIAFVDRNYDTMVDLARRADALSPEGDADIQQTRVAVWAIGVNQGNDILQTDGADPLDAVPYLTKANELMPDSTQGLLSLGIAYISAGEATEAVPVFQRGAEISPNDSRLAYYYGRALILADRPTEAITYLEDAQTRFPDDADVQTMLLNAYTRGGQEDRALERYADAITSRPDDATIRYNYGALLIQAERFDEAIEQLERATELAPDYADAFYNLGAAYQNRAAALNRQANAMEEVDEANALLAERDENLEMALVPLERAREISNDDPSICEALFRVYTQLNRIDDATTVSECAGYSMD